MKTALCAAAAALLSTSFAAALAPQAARAAVITQTFSFDPFTTSFEEANPPPVSLFDSALGTLTSWTVDGVVTATFTDTGGLGTGRAFYTVTTAVPASNSGSCFGNCTINITINRVSVSATLNEFIGTETFEPEITVENFGAGVISSTFDAPFTLTYTYTPAVAAVPEPSTWAMGLIGFGLLGILGYRKTRRDNALA